MQTDALYEHYRSIYTDQCAMSYEIHADHMRLAHFQVFQCITCLKPNFLIIFLIFTTKGSIFDKLK